MMNFDPDVARIIGWTSVHFLWQGALIAAVLACFLARQEKAETRHASAVAAMVLMMAAPAITALVLLLGQQSDAAHATAVAQGMLRELRVPATSLAETTLDARVFAWITAAWTIGTAVMLARLLLHLSRALSLRAGGAGVVPVHWQETLDRLRRQLGIRRPIQIAIHPRILAPVVVGCIRPLVLIPAAALTGLTPDQLHAVLAHELAHIRRLDPLINAMQAVFESVLFFHPAVWWVSRQIRVEREFCCDDAAVMVCGDALVYARALSLLADLGAGEPKLAVASTGGSLMDRIRRIVKSEATPKRATSRPTLVAIVGAAAVIVLLSAGVATAGLDPDPCDKSCCQKNAAGDRDAARIEALLEAMEELGFDRGDRERVLIELRGAQDVEIQAHVTPTRIDFTRLRLLEFNEQLQTAERAQLRAADVAAKQLAYEKQLLAAEIERRARDLTDQDADRLVAVELFLKLRSRERSVADQEAAETARDQVSWDLFEMPFLTSVRAGKIEALIKQLRDREDEIQALKQKLDSLQQRDTSARGGSLLELQFPKGEDAQTIDLARYRKALLDLESDVLDLESDAVREDAQALMLNTHALQAYERSLADADAAMDKELLQATLQKAHKVNAATKIETLRRHLLEQLNELIVEENNLRSAAEGQSQSGKDEKLPSFLNVISTDKRHIKARVEQQKAMEEALRARDSIEAAIAAKAAKQGKGGR